MIIFLKWFKYILLLCFCLTPLVWFKGHPLAIIDGVDTNFPLNPLVWFLRRFYDWNDIGNAGSDFSSSVAGLFFHFIQLVPYLLGFSLHWVELISLIFWFSAIVLGSYFFARVILPKNSLAQLILVSLYSFNIYLFNTWENVKVSNLCLAAVLPAFLALLLAFDKRLLNLSRLIFLATLFAIIASGTGINPAYFLTLIMAIFILSVMRLLYVPQKLERILILKSTFLVLAILFFVNLFWILPTINHLLFSGNKLTQISDIGFNDWVDSLSANTSLLNTFRFQGAWDWYTIDTGSSLPLYIPYAVSYFNRLSFLSYSFLLTGLALVAYLFRRKDQAVLYSFLGVMGVLAIFLGSGSHPPTGTLFNLLDRHVPFFSFFRSPWYIFTPLWILAEAGLIALLISNLKIKSSRWAIGLFTVLVLGNIIYCYPLWTGKIFRPNRPDGFYINFPNYVNQSANWLNDNYSSTSPQRIIAYPNDEIEQFKWGYRGIESILELFAKNEVLFASINGIQSPLDGVVNLFYQTAAKGQREAASNLGEKLNLGLIFQKNDQSSLSQKLPDNFLVTKVTQFNAWSFYKFPNALQPKIFTATNLMANYSVSPAVIEPLSVLPIDSLLINPHDQVVAGIPQSSDFTGQVILTTNSQLTDMTGVKSVGPELNFQQKDLSVVKFSFNIPQKGSYQVVLDRYQVEQFGIDLNNNLKITLDDNDTFLHPDKVTDSFIYFSDLDLSEGNHQLSFNLTESSPILNQGIFKYQLATLDPLSSYLIQFEYKSDYAQSNQLKLEQFSPSSPVQFVSKQLPFSSDWQVYNQYFTPIQTNSKLNIEFTSLNTLGRTGNKAIYQGLTVKKVFLNNLFLINKSDIKPLQTSIINFNQVSPVLYTGEAKNADHPQLLVFSENYSPNWKLSLYDDNGESLIVKPLHFTANNYANAWYIEGVPSSYHFKIYYTPQSILNLGFLISGLTVLISLVFALLQIKKHKLSKK